MIKLFMRRMRERDSRRLFFGLAAAKVTGACLALGGGLFVRHRALPWIDGLLTGRGWRLPSSLAGRDERV